MRIIAVFALFTFVGCNTIPKPVHPNEDLINSYKSVRIINGEKADISDFPWQASLQFFNSHTCGAVIITNRHLVTAAHCLSYPGLTSLYSVKTGSADLMSLVSREVQKITLHPGYDGNVILNDIAIVELKNSIVFDENTKTISLADDTNGVDGENCQISGWGLTEGGTNNIPNLLQKADTTVISNSQCESKWKELISDITIPDSQVCIYNDRTGACNGDSGGPLTCNDVLVGVTSWGVNGCDTSYPSVYTRISYYRDWIGGITGV